LSDYRSMKFHELVRQAFYRFPGWTIFHSISYVSGCIWRPIASFVRENAKIDSIRYMDHDARRSPAFPIHHTKIGRFIRLGWPSEPVFVAREDVIVDFFGSSKRRHAERCKRRRVVFALSSASHRSEARISDLATLSFRATFAFDSRVKIQSFYFYQTRPFLGLIITV
jgi:hypothetical protein